MKIKIDSKIYDIEIYNSPLKRLMGFMFKKEVDKIICFPKCNSIHTFFMNNPIGVIMLDKDFNIIYIEKQLLKNKILIKKKAKYVIELNINLLKNYTQINIIKS